MADKLPATLHESTVNLHGVCARREPRAYVVAAGYSADRDHQTALQKSADLCQPPRTVGNGNDPVYLAVMRGKNGARKW